MKTQDPLKPVGTWDVKRRIKLPALIHAADILTVERAVSALPGVRGLAGDLEKQQLVVRYDASLSSYQAIENILENTGFPPLDNWWNRVKRSWYQYTDTNARENAVTPPPTCCNKPPK